MIEFRKRADKSGERLADGSWPLAGVELVGELDDWHGFADTFVARAHRDGWLEFENPTIASTEVGGIPYDRDPVVTGDVIVLKLAGGDVRYRVLEHPGRYLEADGKTHRVTHEYACELVKGKKG